MQTNPNLANDIDAALNPSSPSNRQESDDTTSLASSHRPSYRKCPPTHTHIFVAFYPTYISFFLNSQFYSLHLYLISNQSCTSAVIWLWSSRAEQHQQPFQTRGPATPSSLWAVTLASHVSLRSRRAPLWSLLLRFKNKRQREPFALQLVEFSTLTESLVLLIYRL